MEISTKANIVTITGNIKSVNDYQNIKKTIDAMIDTHQNIIIEIKDSISITSSIIGYFTKLVQKDGIVLNVKVGDTSLVELFNDLNLVSLFQVRKV